MEASDSGRSRDAGGSIFSRVCHAIGIMDAYRGKSLLERKQNSTLKNPIFLS
jgi:hypothetical protein